MSAKLVLASTSPRRRELLGTLGVSFDVMAPQTLEQRRPGELPSDYVIRNATEKGHDVLGKVADDTLVIAGDTVVVLGDDVLEKPADPDDAKAMLARLAGAKHTVTSGVYVGRKGKETAFAVHTDVYIRPLSGAEIAWYVATGEPMDKAGSYGAQGIGSCLVERVDGSYANVVGLPTAQLAKVLTETFGWPLFQTVPAP